MPRFPILLLVLGIVLPKMGSAQQVDTVYGFPAGAWAMTFCDVKGQVRSWMDMEIPESVQPMIRVHEAKHREQSHRYPSCWVWQTATNTDPMVAMNGEVEAYCAALTVVPTEALPTARADFFRKVWYQFGGVFHIPAPVIAAFEHFCPVPTP